MSSVHPFSSLSYPSLLSSHVQKSTHRNRFFFNSREERRMHVHVATADGTAKFWLEPIVALESYHNLQTKELQRIELIVRRHQEEFASAW